MMIHSLVWKNEGNNLTLGFSSVLQNTKYWLSKEMFRLPVNFRFTFHVNCGLIFTTRINRL